MKYKSLLIETFEHEPGKWRAQITRANRGPLDGRKRKFATSGEHLSRAEALMKAVEVIDAGLFSRNAERRRETYWRRLSKADRKLGAVTSGLKASGSGERSAISGGFAAEREKYL